MPKSKTPEQIEELTAMALAHSLAILAGGRPNLSAKTLAGESFNHAEALQAERDNRYTPTTRKGN